MEPATPYEVLQHCLILLGGFKPSGADWPRNLLAIIHVWTTRLFHSRPGCACGSIYYRIRRSPVPSAHTPFHWTCLPPSASPSLMPPTLAARGGPAEPAGIPWGVPPPAPCPVAPAVPCAQPAAGMHHKESMTAMARKARKAWRTSMHKHYILPPIHGTLCAVPPGW